MTEFNVGAAAAFTAQAGGTISVSSGQNGCNVSKNGKHVGRIDGGRFFGVGLEPRDLAVALVAAAMLEITGIQIQEASQGSGSVAAAS